MDYSALNIYSKDKFILRSVIRNIDFPFIRYTGRNYEELVNFITSYSPNTLIERDVLQIGELYTYSGKYFNLKRIPIGELRFVIASNPYLVTDNGASIPLALDRQQAEIYLKENRHNMMFTYKNTIATYKYNPEHSSFVMYDYLHPTGIPFAQLPDSFEWYIGGKDGANRLWRNTSIHYDDVVHSVDARPSLKGLVGRIQALENKVNQKSCIQGQPMLFPQALENRERRNILKKVCLKRDAFISFINALYMIVFEETRSGSPSHTDTLDRYRDEEFAKVLDALYGYYVLGSSTDRVGINSVFQKYLEHNMGPREPRDYAVLQTGLLTDYHSYLNKILGVVAEELIITGIISLDEAGNLYCGKAVLPQKYYAYRGCQCVIAEPSKNLDEKTNTRYPYTSDRLNSVVLKRKGTISKDREGTFYLDKYIFKNAVPEQLGREAQLQLIRPFEIPRGEYLGEVLDYVSVDAITESGGVEKNLFSASEDAKARPSSVVVGDGKKKSNAGAPQKIWITNYGTEEELTKKIQSVQPSLRGELKEMGLNDKATQSASSAIIIYSVYCIGLTKEKMCTAPAERVVKAPRTTVNLYLKRLYEWYDKLIRMSGDQRNASKVPTLTERWKEEDAPRADFIINNFAELKRVINNTKFVLGNEFGKDTGLQYIPKREKSDAVLGGARDYSDEKDPNNQQARPVNLHPLSGEEKSNNRR